MLRRLQREEKNKVFEFGEPSPTHRPASASTILSRRTPSSRRNNSRSPLLPRANRSHERAPILNHSQHPSKTQATDSNNNPLSSATQKGSMNLSTPTSAQEKRNKFHRRSGTPSQRRSVSQLDLSSEGLPNCTWHGRRDLPLGVRSTAAFPPRHPDSSKVKERKEKKANEGSWEHQREGRMVFATGVPRGRDMCAGRCQWTTRERRKAAKEHRDTHERTPLSFLYVRRTTDPIRIEDLPRQYRSNPNQDAPRQSTSEREAHNLINMSHRWSSCRPIASSSFLCVASKGQSLTNPPRNTGP